MAVRRYLKRHQYKRAVLDAKKFCEQKFDKMIQFPANVLLKKSVHYWVTCCRYVQKCRLMRCKLFMISITKCPLSQKVTKTHTILSNMK